MGGYDYKGRTGTVNPALAVWQQGTVIVTEEPTRCRLRGRFDVFAGRNWAASRD
jgi:hypothetical protein